MKNALNIETVKVGEEIKRVKIECQGLKIEVTYDPYEDIFEISKDHFGTSGRLISYPVGTKTIAIVNNIKGTEHAV